MAIGMKRPSFYMKSKEWLQIKNWIEGEISHTYTGLDNVKTWEEALALRERIKVLKTFLSWEDASDAQD